MEVWVGLATVLVGALATGILTYVNVRSRARTERAVVDQVRIRDLRRPHYQRLFQISQIIARVPADDANGWRSHPRGAAAALENWYFEHGAGMFLSEDARTRFFELLDALESGAASLDPRKSLPEKEARAICVLAGALRTQLSVDMTVVGDQPSEPAAGAGGSRA